PASALDSAERKRRSAAHSETLSLGGSVYDLHEVVKWFVSRQTEDSGMLNSRNERARKDKAMADKYVRENRIAEGELLTVGEVVRIVSDANHRAKTRLLRLPRAIAIAVPRECAREAEAESENLINEALEELANPDEFRSDSIEGEPCDSADLEASA
ncbi:MAG: hypothetical protein AAFX93_20370, partial [Verrucomicrobiota bacterium]